MIPSKAAMEAAREYASKHSNWFFCLSAAYAIDFAALQQENERFYAENDRLDELRFRIHPKDSDLSETWQEAYEVKVRDEQTLRSELQAARAEEERWRLIAQKLGVEFHDLKKLVKIPDTSPGEVIASYPDGTIVLDCGTTTWNPERAYEYLKAQLAAAQEQVREKDAQISDMRLDLACPDCGCATVQDADSKECGCDGVVCTRTMPLAKAYAASQRDLEHATDLSNNLGKQLHVAKNSITKSEQQLREKEAEIESNIKHHQEGVKQLLSDLAASQEDMQEIIDSLAAFLTVHKKTVIA